MKKDRKMLDKLKNLVEEEPNPKREPAPEPEEIPAVLSERRKKALLAYLALLFGAAFVVVAVSMVLTWKSHQATVDQLNINTSNAMSRAEALQEESQILQQRVKDLETSLEYSETALEYNEAALEYSEAKNQEYVENIRNEAALTVERKAQAYELLLRAQQAIETLDEENFAEAMLRLESLADELGSVGTETYHTLLAFDWRSVQTD